jgi:uncharacterized protein
VIILFEFYQLPSSKAFQMASFPAITRVVYKAKNMRHQTKSVRLPSIVSTQVIQPKKNFLFKIEFMKVLTCFLLLMVSGKSFCQTKNFIDQPYIEVTGNADTLIVPNEIFVKIIVTEKDGRDRISLDEIQKRLIDSLQLFGIDVEKNLSIYNLGNSYQDYIFKRREVVQSKEYVVKLADAVVLSKLFMTLDDLKIGNASIIALNHTQMEQMKAQMQMKAIENAKKQANLLTKTIGQSIGAAIHIGDAAPAQNILQGNANAIRVRDIQSFSKQEKLFQQPKIEFEKIKISATVPVKFTLLAK